MSTKNKGNSTVKAKTGSAGTDPKNVKKKKQDNPNGQTNKESENNLNKNAKGNIKHEINSIEDGNKASTNKEIANNSNNKNLINNTAKMETSDDKNKIKTNPNLNDGIPDDTDHGNHNVKSSEVKGESKTNTSSNNKQTNNPKGDKDSYENSQSSSYHKTSGHSSSSGYSSTSGYHSSSGYSSSTGYPSSSYGYSSSSYGYSGSNYGYSNYKEKIKGIYGFYNTKITNNCFMNSSLQNLLHCEDFANRMHSISDTNLYNKPLAKEIKNLMTQIYNGENELDPRKIKVILSEVEEKYKYNEQNDANEFITIFLNQLLKELNGTSPNEYQTEKIPKTELELKAFYKLEDKFFLKNRSFLLNLFYGRLKREYTCKKGHVVSIKFNNFNTLILPHPEDSDKLVDLLNLYQKEKLINDTIFCNDCQKECQYKIATKIYNIPKYFIVCLEKESDYNYTGISFPLDLKTDKFMKNGYENGNYYLNSYIEYSGNRKSGHYTAKVCQDNKWYSISDSYYHPIDNSELYNKSAIILFYTRID